MSSVTEAGRAVGPGAGGAESALPTAKSRGWRGMRDWPRGLANSNAAMTLLGLVAVVGAGAVVRLVRLMALGFNSDEAVYAGQGASLAGNHLFTDQFPIFRAHPLLFQTVLSMFYTSGGGDLGPRLLAVAVGLLTIVVVFLLGRELYGRGAGLLAAGAIAIMPYHVVVTRQVLLDGPMTLVASVSLLLLARYGRTGRVAWFVASGAALGMAMLVKETAIVLIAGVYAFLVLTPTARRRLRGAVVALPLLIAVFAVYPLSLRLAGGTRPKGNYFTYQLLRRANHGWGFYPSTLPWAIGPALLILAVGGLFWAKRSNSWREVLLLSWIGSEVFCFELFPVKGFQYLLPIAPPVAVLAARGLLTMRIPRRFVSALPFQMIIAALVTVSLLVPTLKKVTQTDQRTLLAGSGGMPYGREAGQWLAAHTPAGSKVLTLGPSLANVLAFYGHRTAYGLSVSTNPANRNPAYLPLANPDNAIRTSQVQYVAWDAFSAKRSPYFAARLNKLVRRHDGRAIFVRTVSDKAGSGHSVPVRVLVIYEVRG
jgi:4-amino-4-deoxy-L-arabinose transferase-like glycosyltransferase